MLGESVFQVATKARDGADLFTEHAKLLSEYEKIVAKAKRSTAATGQPSPREHWREAVKEAETLEEGITGVQNEDEARLVLADDLRHRGGDPVLYRAVVAPDADEPAVTMLDVKEMYRKERMTGAQAHNSFERLEIAKANTAPDNEFDKRNPLPRDVILKMRQRMETTLREPALGVTGRLLEGTGCRGSEIVGLRAEDVQLDCKYPYIRAMWHEDRRVKTKVSICSVPLIGDALEVAKEAVKPAKGEHMRFPRLCP